MILESILEELKKLNAHLAQASNVPVPLPPPPPPPLAAELVSAPVTAKAPAKKQKAAPAPEASLPPKEEPKAVTKEDVIAALRAYATRNSRTAAIDLMRKHTGEKEINMVPPEKYGELFAALE